MQRRTVLRSMAAVSGGLAMAGCLGDTLESTGNGGDSTPTETPVHSENVTLAHPSDYPTSYSPKFLSWDDQLPDATVTAPLEDRSVALRDLNVPAVFTFFFSHCQTVCPVLVSSLREIQTHASNNGYDDQIALVPITFDPERDTAERLRTYAEEMNVDADAENWQFLRPDSVEKANSVIQDEFGVEFKKQPQEEGDGYMFDHRSLIVLTNAEGYVERAYRGSEPQTEQIIEDLETVRTQ